MNIFPRLEKKYPCDFCLLQETQTSSAEEAELENKFLKRGKSLTLSSWDSHEAAFEARIDNTTKKGKWGTGIIQYGDNELVEIETGTDRFQAIHNNNMVIVNIYFPTDKGLEGIEDYEVCLKELEVFLEKELGDRELSIIGDANYQPNHHPRRREALESLCSKFKLTRHVPRETTYFAPNGDRSTLDMAMTSKGFTNIKYKVLTGEYVPGNLSTHAIVRWSMDIEEEELPEKKKMATREKEGGPTLFKRYPRVNWEEGLDRDLYYKKERSYLRVGLRVSNGLPAPWRMALVQDLMAEASEHARVRTKDREGNEDMNTVMVCLEKKISHKWREIKRRMWH